MPAVSPIPVYACKIEDDAIWVDPEQQLNDARSRTSRSTDRVPGSGIAVVVLQLPGGT